MADSEHTERLIRSVEEWNQWRKQEHSGIRPDLCNSDLSSADLSNANLAIADLSSANLSGANLSGANLISTNLSDTNLCSAYLYGAILATANLNSANLSKANLHSANPIFANLRKADLSSADLSEAYFCGANLSGANLSGANLSGADFRETDLSGAGLSGANLSSINLSGANLSGADLSSTILRKANLSSANLSRAILHNTNLSGANLSSTNLSSAILWYTTFADVDLRSTKGLVEIHHSGPSIIELHSIQLPQDDSALHFLRGVGVPDEWIDFYRTMMMHPIQYYSCFLSYSSTDELIVKRLHADLQANGVRCWFAPHDLKPGNYVRKEIHLAIHIQDKLLLVLSESAVNSGWVGYEVELALAREIRQQREILFPICLDNEVLQSSSDWVTMLQATRHIGDFTNWRDPPTYQQRFDRLLQDLKKANV